MDERRFGIERQRCDGLKAGLSRYLGRIVLAAGLLLTSLPPATADDATLREFPNESVPAPGRLIQVLDQRQLLQRGQAQLSQDTQRMMALAEALLKDLTPEARQQLQKMAGDYVRQNGIPRDMGQLRDAVGQFQQQLEADPALRDELKQKLSQQPGLAAGPEGNAGPGTQGALPGGQAPQGGMPNLDPDLRQRLEQQFGTGGSGSGQPAVPFPPSNAKDNSGNPTASGGAPNGPLPNPESADAQPGGRTSRNPSSTNNQSGGRSPAGSQPTPSPGQSPTRSRTPAAQRSEPNQPEDPPTRGKLRSEFNRILYEAARSAASDPEQPDSPDSSRVADSLSPLMNRVMSSMRESIGNHGGQTRRNFTRQWQRQNNTFRRSATNQAINRWFRNGRNRSSSLVMPETSSLWWVAGLGTSLGLGLVALAVIRMRRSQRLQDLLVRHWKARKPRPGALRSRHDLVRAVDRLVNWRFGPAAQWWHGGVVERALAGDYPHLEPQIMALVASYETARYAPESGTVSRDQLDQSAGTIRQLLSLEVPDHEAPVSAARPTVQ